MSLVNQATDLLSVGAELDPRALLGVRAAFSMWHPNLRLCSGTEITTQNRIMAPQKKKKRRKKRKESLVVFPKCSVIKQETQ